MAEFLILWSLGLIGPKVTLERRPGYQLRLYYAGKNISGSAGVRRPAPTEIDADANLGEFQCWLHFRVYDRRRYLIVHLIRPVLATDSFGRTFGTTESVYLYLNPPLI